MDSLTPIQAVVLTGTRDSHNPLIAHLSVRSKVLLPILGKPMLLYVLDTLTASRYQPQLYVSSSDPDVLGLNDTHPFISVTSQDKAVKSMLHAIHTVPGDDWLLFVSGDHPLLTVEMVDYFIDEVLRRNLDFGVAAVRRSVVNQHYPASKRTYFPVKGDAYSGGNLFLVNRKTFHGNPLFMEAMDRNRKKPWKNLVMANPITALRILLRQMDIHGVAQEASRVFKCHAGIVDMPFAECCMDVDKASDQAMAEIILKERLKAGAQTDFLPTVTLIHQSLGA